MQGDKVALPFKHPFLHGGFATMEENTLFLHQELGKQGSTWTIIPILAYIKRQVKGDEG